MVMLVELYTVCTTVGKIESSISIGKFMLVVSLTKCTRFGKRCCSLLGLYVVYVHATAMGCLKTRCIYSTI